MVMQKTLHRRCTQDNVGLTQVATQTGHDLWWKGRREEENTHIEPLESYQLLHGTRPANQDKVQTREANGASDRDPGQSARGQGGKKGLEERLGRGAVIEVGIREGR